MAEPAYDRGPNTTPGARDGRTDFVRAPRAGNTNHRSGARPIRSTQAQNITNAAVQYKQSNTPSASNDNPFYNRADDAGSKNYRGIKRRRPGAEGPAKKGKNSAVGWQEVDGVMKKSRTKQYVNSAANDNNEDVKTLFIGTASRKLTAWPMIFGTLTYWAAVQFPFAIIPLGVLALNELKNTILGNLLVKAVEGLASLTPTILREAVRDLAEPVLAGVVAGWVLICLIFAAVPILTCYAIFFFTGTKSVSPSSDKGWAKSLLFLLAWVGSVVPILPWTTLWVFFVTRFPK